MNSLFKSDTTKILLYFILTLTTAAAIAPWTYNAGKMIVEVREMRAHDQSANGIITLLEQTNFAWFFILTLAAVALAFAIPLICWLRLSTKTNIPFSRPWTLRLPNHQLPETGQPLSSTNRSSIMGATGFLLAGSTLLLMNWLFLIAGWYKFTLPSQWISILIWSLVIAFLLASITEWLFRGVILGIILRSLRPTLAIFITTLLYSALHFLLPDGNHIIQQGNEPNAGFLFIAESVMQLSKQPEQLAGFTTMLFSGIILGYARYQTTSLALPIGLQTGWIFILLLSHQIIAHSQPALENISLLIGDDRRSGFVPLCFIIATGLLIHVLLQNRSETNTQPENTN